MNNVEILQVKVNKLLGVSLDCKLSWSKHIDTTVAKMSILKRYSAFLTTLSTRQVLHALVLSHLDYCSVVWSGATKRDLEILHGWPVKVPGELTLIMCMSISHGSK